jgi:rubrerythrin
MTKLPDTAPASIGDAFKHINAVTHPTLDDMKLMVFLEASGQSSYYALADRAPNAQVGELLRANGAEELDHAERVCQAIKLLHGVDFRPPTVDENPYAGGPGAAVTRELLEGVVRGEDNGCALYQAWADNTANPDAAQLFRLNAVEETLHGQRAAKAITLLEGV